MAERALPGRNELRWWPAMPSDVRLREMAEAEPIGRLRERLADIARQYEALATALPFNRSRA